MNRHILFRAKRVDNDEWAFGDLITSKDKYYIHPQANAFQVDGTLSRLVVLHEVKKESIGQFTGLIDNRGCPIFEGDVLKIISSVRSEIIDITRAFQSAKREDCAVVLCDYKTGGYKLKVYHKGKYKRISKFAIGHLCSYKAEVIGNIYDNPELLYNGD